MSYNLFLDDERLPHNVTWAYMPTHVDWEWVIVRNYDEFVKCIQENGLPNFVTFDHDLALEHYKEGHAGLPPLYDQYKERTGYHCAEWMLHYCLDRNLELPEWSVHSMSVVGKANIVRMLNKENVLRMRRILNNL